MNHILYCSVVVVVIKTIFTILFILGFVHTVLTYINLFSMDQVIKWSILVVLFVALTHS